jgi:hypothetical protein
LELSVAAVPLPSFEVGELLQVVDRFRRRGHLAEGVEGRREGAQTSRNNMKPAKEGNQI